MPRSGNPSSRGALRVLVAQAVDLLFPPRCAGCKAHGHDFCPACQNRLQRIEKPICGHCGRPLQAGSICGACRQGPPPLRMRSYALYQGGVIGALLALKYRPNRRLAGMMALWLADLLRQTRWAVDLLVPIPLGRDRLRHRGYNQTDLIARPLAAMIDCPLNPRALRRIRNTRSQVGLPPWERRRNVAGAFVADEKAVRGRKVLLIDDLITTGATMRACAQALHAAGAGEVYGLSIARAL